ncbi:MAG: D-aminoacylase [Ancalomicrobiaceae bacterium]|nr:D-aminoacylase [Ancalomicrobiaceae bacterium]
MADQQTVVRGARIIDGTGAPWFRGDLLIDGGRIAAIGHTLSAGPGAVVVDAGERYLAPGFIDAHCHDDLIFLREPDRPEKAHQGVTSIVVGNCSFSLYPATDGSREELRQHFSGLLGETRASEIFADFDAYRHQLHGAGIALNLVSLVGHAALRLAVMGYARRAPIPAEIEAMCALLSAQLSQGAAGLSLGLVYPPSAFAGSEELIALGRTVAAHGKLVAAHVRSYEAALIPAIEEFCDLLSNAGVAGLLSHLQSAGRPNWGKVPAAIERLERYRADGVDVSFDMYPYPAGSTWLAQLMPAAAFDGGIAAAKARLADPKSRAVLRDWIEHGGPAFPGESKVALIGWDNVRLSAVGVAELKQLEGLSMRAAADRLGVDAFDLMARLIDADDGQTGIILFQLAEDDLRAACCHRLHMVGSDGLPRPGTRPHPRAFGTFPRVAGPLRRENGWFSIEDAVRRMTSIAAQRFGLSDRGLVRPGMAADLVLFEDAVADRASFDAPTELPTGISHVWVNGGAVIADGEPTGQRPGRVL